MDTKKELPHFYIGESLGGQQKWYSRITDFAMNVGGCAAVSACDCAIYFAKYFGLRGLYPFDLENISREDYLRFGKIMELYLYPRWTGVDKLEIYLDGFGRFLQERGVDLKLSGWSGENNFDDTRKIICRQIDAGILIPCLNLKHKAAELQKYVWHWFILNGYEVRGENFFVKAVSYGIGRWINFATLWETGYERKGGLILFEI
ncbi:MAG: hypothetical protein SR3Q1_06945 [Quinella sp. 3Q1]|nr:hypothetical protein [Quinella sp. 3Q1]MBR6887138.1 hypothetical protein [Selenomonadaceae bacterium]